MTLEIGTILPTSTPDPARPILGDVRASARFAEQVGLDSVWSTDHLVASAPILDSTVVLATAAAVTDRVRIGYSVMLLALRPAAWAAKQIATLQYVSGDRLILGVGTGNPAHGDVGWRAAGAPFAERGRRTDEALRVLPDLVAGRPTTLPDGTAVTLAPGASMPPVLVAGGGAAARRRAAAYAEGWVTIGLEPDQVRASKAELASLAEGYGRRPPTVTIVAPQLATDPGYAADQLAAYADAGVERVILAPSGAEWRADYEFAAKIKEQLKTQLTR
ncbi:LLM class flavin-dependent oxidoreductase [Nocardia amamiensis]|uniref:LLM class flavin-dependent oxidoreductase n=1 Tax=Nocardia amamiensis TaxID=404578 RepID=A0ABS0CWZ6_9NOCA|nr:LLM class flavin-dependent oxidoreductase [Nocardia amamiensis]MBF6301122.1 LLM class flavin-dependent oxidoreductase [Nocardia amamiensis]